MNHKTILLLISLFLISAIGFSQKLKDKKISVPYVSIPSKKIPDTYTTYSVKVYGGAFNYNTRDPYLTVNSIHMDGFKRLSGQGSDFGHLRVYATASTPLIGTIIPRSRTSVSKDKSGNEKRSTVYWYEFPVQAYTSYQVVDPEGNVIASGRDREEKRLETRRTGTPTGVISRYNQQIVRERDKFANKLINNMVSRVNNALRYQFDFANSKAREDFYFIKGGSYEKPMAEAFNEAKIVWESRDPASSVIETNDMLMDVLKQWSEIASLQPGNDTKLQRVYKAANYNLALTYFYLDDFKKARLYAQNVIDSEGKDKPSNQLLKKINKLEERMELHAIFTQHYIRDISNAAGPARVQSFEEEQEEMKENNNTLDGNIFWNGKEIKGQFVCEKEADELIFGREGNTKFVVTEGTNTKEYELTDAAITSFKIGNRSFVKMPFSPSSKGREETKMHILEELYSSKQITLYQYYSSQGTLANEDTEYAYKRLNDRFPISLLDTQFLLFDKGMSQYFESCPDLSEMCARGEIKLTQADLLRAARVYAEVCN